VFEFEVLGGDVSAALIDFYLQLNGGLIVGDVKDFEIGVEDVDGGLFKEVACGDNAFAFVLEGEDDRLVLIEA